MTVSGEVIGSGLSVPNFFQSGHFGKQFDLDLLDFGQALPLAGQQMVDFFMQVPNLQFRLEVDTVVVLVAQAVLGFLPILAHLDHRCLNGSEEGENQVEQDKRIGVEGFGRYSGGGRGGRLTLGTRVEISACMLAVPDCRRWKLSGPSVPHPDIHPQCLEPHAPQYTPPRLCGNRY